MRERDSYPASRRRGKQLWDDEEPRQSRSVKRLPADDLHDAVDGLPSGDRWSVWDVSSPLQRGPKPYPPWLITDLGAVDTELGVLKTGKEADVILLQRAVPDTDRACLLASKRYRSSEHRMFHRDSGYLEGRRTRRSRDARAVAKRTQYGRQAIAGQWANAEFAALCQLHQNGVPAPYPVQIVGTELLLEFIGDPDGSAAPRLAQLRPDPEELADLWEQLVDALARMARLGLAHGDLSPYNILVDHGRLVLIDVPQIVDVVANPQGPTFLDRDATVVANWFAARGLLGVDGLPGLLRKEAGLR